jgi:hypothetical protein
MVKVHTVTGIATLRDVRALRRNTRIALAIPSLASEESQRLEVLLNGFVSECGCNASAVALMLGVAACMLFDVALKAHSFKTLGINLLVCFAATVIGKCAGRLRAKWKLARTIRMVEAKLD